MGRSQTGVPTATPTRTTKSDLLARLKTLDEDQAGVRRVLAMEVDFRKRIASHVGSLPPKDAVFAKFSTNPFVLLIHAMKQKYKRVSEIEQDILPAKLFSSMETSAGRMIEQVVLPVYGWEYVPSAMHSADSVVDGRQKTRDVLRLATLKSGPRCLNDDMSENIADAILAHVSGWAKTAGVAEVDFTYGVLYGTQKLSNKKDWHILRNIKEKTPAADIQVAPEDRWTCRFMKDGVTVTVTVRIGLGLWAHFGDDSQTFFEMACAAIRSCVVPSDVDGDDHKFTIQDLPSIISLDVVPESYNVSLLQRSQLEWFFFFARHFYDDLLNL
ncbi:MAG: PmeII family type II restriction endonuclease [Gemmataceae bacterium]